MPPATCTVAERQEAVSVRLLCFGASAWVRRTSLGDKHGAQIGPWKRAAGQKSSRAKVVASK